MKPSERINQLSEAQLAGLREACSAAYWEKYRRQLEDAADMRAVVQYLDEQHTATGLQTRKRALAELLGSLRGGFVPNARAVNLLLELAGLDQRTQDGSSISRVLRDVEAEARVKGLL